MAVTPANHTCEFAQRKALSDKSHMKSTYEFHILFTVITCSQQMLPVHISVTVSTCSQQIRPAHILVRVITCSQQMPPALPFTSQSLSVHPPPKPCTPSPLEPRVHYPPEPCIHPVTLWTAFNKFKILFDPCRAGICHGRINQYKQFPTQFTQ